MWPRFYCGVCHYWYAYITRRCIEVAIILNRTFAFFSMRAFSRFSFILGRYFCESASASRFAVLIFCSQAFRHRPCFAPVTIFLQFFSSPSFSGPGAPLGISIFLNRLLALGSTIWFLSLICSDQPRSCAEASAFARSISFFLFFLFFSFFFFYFVVHFFLHF